MKQSFIVYTQQLEKARKLNMEQRGKLLTAILDYHCEEEPNIDDPLVDMLFSMMKDSFDNSLDYAELIVSAAYRNENTETDNNINLNNLFDDNTPDTSTDKPSETKKKHTTKKPDPVLTAEELEFFDWMKNNYPRIYKMKKPMTLAQYNTLVDKYGRDGVLVAMRNLENYAPLNKYISASMTLDKWCKNDVERRKQKQTQNQTYNNGTNKPYNTVNDPNNLIAALQQHHAEQKRNEDI